MTTDEAAPARLPGRGDRVMLDANLLLRVTAPADPRHRTALNAVAKLEAAGAECVTATQALCEFWVVATRPAGSPNGFGRTIAQADVGLRRLETQFTFLEDPPTTRDVWRRLVRDRGVAGKPAHDARLAATAIAAGVPAVLTFNVGDFARFAADGLAALDPAAV